MMLTGGKGPCCSVLGPERFQLLLKAKSFLTGSQDASWTWTSAFGRSMRTVQKTDVVGDTRIKGLGTLFAHVYTSS